MLINMYNHSATKKPQKVQCCYDTDVYDDTDVCACKFLIATIYITLFHTLQPSPEILISEPQKTNDICTYQKIKSCVF